MRAEDQRVLEDLKQVIQALPTGKWEFLRGYAEGLVAQRDNPTDKMEKAG